MSEPRLEDISDYDTLKGSKKKVVLAVIFAGLFIGVIYTIVYSLYDNDDNIKIEETIKTIPMR